MTVHASDRRSFKRPLALAAVATACAALAIGYAFKVQSARVAASAAAGLRIVEAAQLPPTDGSRPFVVFRGTSFGPEHGRVSYVHLDGDRLERSVTPLACDRVHYAGERGICLAAKRGVTASYRAILFDRDLRTLAEFPLAGPPSRARMSADASLAAMTVFRTGHSYDSIDFTTRTSIVDVARGTIVVEDLEAFTVLRDGKPFRAQDFNFWGVTFARDGRRFYATLGTGGERLLLEGDLDARQMRVIRSDVECPSLSPDGTRVAFKRRSAPTADGRRPWRIHVLELASGRETLLSEARSVDDQVEWNGNGEIVYALPDDRPDAAGGTALWAVRADGGDSPRLWLPLAYSPALAR